MTSSIEIDQEKKTCEIVRNRTLALKINIGESLGPIKNVLSTESETDVEFDAAKLQIAWHSYQDNLDHFEFSWKTDSGVQYLKDTIDLHGSVWFGGPQTNDMKWPIPASTHDFQPFVVADVFKKAISGHEPYWLSSNKVSIHVFDKNVPLWTRHNDAYLTLQSLPNEPPYGMFQEPSDVVFSYRVYVGTENLLLKDFFMCHKKFIYKNSKGIPSERTILKPIWTTWARFKAEVSEADVLNFASNIDENRFEASQIELDDKWSTNYGDFMFDSQKFPDIEQLVQKLKANNIELTLWIHPFVAPDSQNERDQKLREYFVQTKEGEARTKEWWHGDAFIVDFTNPEARNWFAKNLDQLRKIGVAGFKFDAGEVSYLPEDFVLKNGSTPNDFTKAYIEFAAQNFASEARVGFKTQEQAIFIRTMDRLSTWNNCGIQTVLPILFNYAVCGYNFNLPDMIGGNSYDGKLCDKQLFVRWVQLNTFLMSMQFSIAPWDFDQETIRVCQKMMAVRKEHIIYLIEQFKSSTQGNLPIRPLWWAIESEEAVECSDQFLVGDNLLVAPVLQEDQWSRTVLLPEGSWRDHDGIEHTGGKKIIVQSPLDVLPYYKRT